MISIIFREYFFLRQRIPIFIYVFYIHFRDLESPIIDRVITTLLTFMGLMSAYTFTGLMLKIPFTDMIPFNWTYYGLIHWCIFFIFFHQLAIRRGMSNLTAFTLATLAVVGGGWLYEVPFWYPVSMFLTRFSIFYLNTQIVCLLCLIYEIRRMGFRPNKLIIMMGLIFLVFSNMLSTLRVVPHIADTAFNHLLRANIWFYRVPASLLLISLLSGIERKEK